MSEFESPAYNGEILTLVSGLAAPVTVILSVLLLDRRHGLFRRLAKKGGRNVLSIILSIIISLSLLTTPVRLILMWAFPCFSSETTDLSSYLKFDTWVITTTKGEILKLFPEEIPDIVTQDDGRSEIEYYYKYKGGLGAGADIFVQWTMESRSEFNKEKSRIDGYA